MSTITIGVDLAKSVFSACAVGGAGRVLRRRDLRRDAFGPWLAQQPTGTVVAMEACSGAHHWARCCLAYGLQPRIDAAVQRDVDAEDQESHGVFRSSCAVRGPPPDFEGTSPVREVLTPCRLTQR